MVFFRSILSTCKVSAFRRKIRYRERNVNDCTFDHAKRRRGEILPLAEARNANRDHTVSRVPGIRPLNGSDLNLAANFKVFLLETAPFQLVESESVDRLFLASPLAPLSSCAPRLLVVSSPSSSTTTSRPVESLG